MNSLEFINEEIEKLKAFLELDDVLCELSDNDHKFYNDKLQTLQQIKEELEAWKICKEDCVIYSILKELSKGGSINYHKLPEKQQEKLKKALEVKNEK